MTADVNHGAFNVSLRKQVEATKTRKKVNRVLLFSELVSALYRKDCQKTAICDKLIRSASDVLNDIKANTPWDEDAIFCYNPCR